MEIATLHSKLEEAEDSCVYLRSNSSSSPKFFMASKTRSSVSHSGQGPSKMNQQAQHPHPHKKQVRRRLHTSRPYQERLLDMAQARREIATALKLHRAAMKQANEQKEQQQKERDLTIPKSERSFSCGSLSYSSPSPPSFTAYPLQWPASVFNFPLPEQPLGLNLNLHDFTRSLDSSSPSSSSSPISISTQAPSSLSDSTILPPHAKVSDGMESSSSADDEMVEMGSLVDHQWNDTINLLSSAWSSKFSKPDSEEVKSKSTEPDDSCLHPFDELMKSPSWLNPNLAGIASSALNHDYDLPRMDIEDIDGVVGEWLP